MPYIESDKRGVVELGFIQTSGELNYAITSLILRALQMEAEGHVTYHDLNTIVGVLECVKLEFYRRAVVPYEDKKIVENGDVY